MSEYYIYKVEYCEGDIRFIIHKSNDDKYEKSYKVETGKNGIPFIIEYQSTKDKRATIGWTYLKEEGDK